MNLNLDIIKEEIEESDEQKSYEQKEKIQQLTIKDDMEFQNEQFIPDEILEDDCNRESNVENIQQMATVVLTGLGGFYSDQAIDYQESKPHQQQYRRLTIYSNFSQIFRQSEVEFDKLESQNHNLFENFSALLAWVILLYQTLNNAMIPAWIMTIPLDKYLRITWRFLIQSLFLIPLMMYEQRTGSLEVKLQYEIQYILKWENMRQLYYASLSPTIASAIFLFCFDYNYVATIFILGSQTNFWLSFCREKTQNHFIEKRGQIFSFFGFLLICIESLAMNKQGIPVIANNYINTSVFIQVPLLRLLIGSAVPFVSSYLLARCSEFNKRVRSSFPLYLSNYFIAIFVSFNIFIVAYFVDGISLDNNPNFGFFGLFTNQKFIEFFYTSLIIIIGIYICSVMTIKLFDPLILSIFNLLEPLISSIFCKFSGVQYYPDLLSYLGYFWLQFGQLLIILGQDWHKKQQDMNAKQNLQCKSSWSKKTL
ncbi:unnamed protein product [Paramecium sonneborni]|uniref:Transmembrane protein n=1 Tax=Paramecium sonneborni TaxID=65129 RepID=A0A8S1QGZ5_9CILI|nr:unnamed protein product [Paramecium sonneborni]